jgi:hypothetical protein
MAGRIIRHPEQYEGQEVTVVGYFRGLDLLDEVVLDAPKGRVEDWVIADDSGAIWVAFAGKLPFPPTSHEVWRILRVRGQVEVHRNGMPFLVPIEVQWEGLVGDRDVLPALCKVAIHQTGGPAALDRHMYWYSTGTLALIDAGKDIRGSANLRSGDVYDLDVAWRRVRFFDLASTLGSECEDCVRYEIAAVNDRSNTPHFVTTYDQDMPGTLQAFIDVVNEKVADAETVR